MGNSEGSREEWDNQLPSRLILLSMHLRATSHQRAPASPEIVTHGVDDAAGGIVEVKSTPLLPLGQALLVLFSSSGQTAQQQVIQSLDFIAARSKDGLLSILEPICFHLMKKKQEREIDFEMGQLHERHGKAFNRTLLDLIASKDLVVRTAAAKMVIMITRYHFETGKLLAKASPVSKPKIEIISDFPTTSFTLIESKSATILELLAEAVLEPLIKEMQSPKPTLRHVIFADATAVLLRAISHTLRNEDLHSDENSTLRAENLVQVFDIAYTTYLSCLSSWWGSIRPLHSHLVSSMLRMGINSNARLHLAGELFGELNDSEVAHLTAAEIPLALHIRSLEDLLKSDSNTTRSTIGGTSLFERLYRIAAKLSFPSSAVSASLIQLHKISISSNMNKVLFSCTAEAEAVSLAAEILRFAKIVPSDFETLFWDTMIYSPLKHSQELFRFYTWIPRTSETRVALLNRILKGWNGADNLKTNCHALLLFILRSPEDSQELFILLNNYVSKNSNISKIQSLVTDAQPL